jgi:hypothetical protein
LGSVPRCSSASHSFSANGADIMRDLLTGIWRHKGKLLLIGALLYAGLGVVLGYHDYNRAIEIVTSAIAAAFVGS